MGEGPRGRDAVLQSISWEDLRVTWGTLGTMLGQYEVSSAAFASITEARRLVEVEMRQQGFEDRWLELEG